MRILSDILKLRLWNLTQGNLELYTKYIHSLPYFYKSENTPSSASVNSRQNNNNQYANPHYSPHAPHHNPHYTNEPAFSAISLFDELFLLKETTADFSIVLGHDEIKVHKWVLSQWDFFTEKIASFNFEYKHIIPVSTFKKLVQYYYTDNVSIFNHEDCVAILTNADYFKVDPSLRNYCYHYLQI
jgi:hypothetical protein